MSTIPLKNWQKPKKTGELRARCEEQLELGFQQLATIRRLDVSDLVREACWNFLTQQHERIGRP